MARGSASNRWLIGADRVETTSADRATETIVVRVRAATVIGRRSADRAITALDATTARPSTVGAGLTIGVPANDRGGTTTARGGITTNPSVVSITRGEISSAPSVVSITRGEISSAPSVVTIGRGGTTTDHDGTIGPRATIGHLATARVGRIARRLNVRVRKTDVVSTVHGAM